MGIGIIVYTAARLQNIWVRILQLKELLSTVETPKKGFILLLKLDVKYLH